MHRPALLGKMGNERSSDLYKKQYVGESVANFEPGGRRFESVQARHSYLFKSNGYRLSQSPPFASVLPAPEFFRTLIYTLCLPPPTVPPVSGRFKVTRTAYCGYLMVFREAHC